MYMSLKLVISMAVVPVSPTCARISKRENRNGRHLPASCLHNKIEDALFQLTPIFSTGSSSSLHQDQDIGPTSQNVSRCGGAKRQSPWIQTGTIGNIVN